MLHLCLDVVQQILLDPTRVNKLRPQHVLFHLLVFLHLNLGVQLLDQLVLYLQLS